MALLSSGHRRRWRRYSPSVGVDVEELQVAPARPRLRRFPASGASRPRTAATQTSTRRAAHSVWHGYALYNPAMLEEYLTIFRTVSNFVFVGDDRKTPAMRLG